MYSRQHVRGPGFDSTDTHMHMIRFVQTVVFNKRVILLDIRGKYFFKNIILKLVCLGDLN